MFDFRGIRTCATCGAFQSYPRPICDRCKGREFSATPMPVTGEIFSLTVVQRAPTPAFAEAVPYTVALVRGRDGGLLMMQLHDFAETPEIGAPVSIEADGDKMVGRPPRTG